MRRSLGGRWAPPGFSPGSALPIKSLHWETPAESPWPKVKVIMCRAPLRIRTIGLTVTLVALVVLAAAPMAGASGPLAVQAAIDPAFERALQAPSGDRLPNPVRMTLGAAAERRATLAASSLPSYYLGDDVRLSPVKDQRSYGTCWAFANIGALESALLPGETWNFSEDNLVTRSGFGPFPGGAYEWGGFDAMAVAYFARWAGPVTERDDPYPSPRVPAVNPVQKHVQDVIMLPGRSSVYDNDLLKQMVYEHGAVSVGMFWRDGAYQSSTYGFYDRNAEGENHGVCIVGWDDSYPATNFKVTPSGGDGAFIVRNSWGGGWGDGGNFYVSYYDRSFAFYDCTSYARVDGPEDFGRIYQYDKLGLVESLRPTSGQLDVARFANQFTARASANVTAAGFYATSADATYKVLAGPTMQSLTTRATGTFTLPGFHTVSFDTPLPVTRGGRFVVAVRLTTPGNYPIPIETRVRGYSSAASASPGQSYVRSSNASRWKDLTSIRGYAEANVCLKAYTD